MSQFTERWRFNLLRGGAYFGLLRRRLRGRSLGLYDARRAFFERVWQEAAGAIGGEYEPLGDGFGAIRLDGSATRVWQGHVMLDDPVTLKVAGNKPLANQILRAAGVRVPDFLGFPISQLPRGLAFMQQKAGSACVVKPASGTGAGRGVTTDVTNRRDFLRAAAQASVYGQKLIIEEQVAGENYRLLYLDGVLLDAICRRSPHVVGDGRSTIVQLIRAENRRRVEHSQKTVLRAIEFGPDLYASLRKAGLALKSVPDAGVRVIVHGVSNNNSERDNLAVNDRVSPELVDHGRRAALALGVTLAGVDVITTDPTRPLEETGGVINEVNTTPGLHHHYQVANPEQRPPIGIPILRHLLGLTED